MSRRKPTEEDRVEEGGTGEEAGEFKLERTTWAKIWAQFQGRSGLEMNLEKPSQSHMTQCHTVSHVKVSRYGQSSQRTALTCIHFSCQNFVRHQPPKHHSSNSNYRVTVVSCANHTVQTLVPALQATNHYVVRREWSQSREKQKNPGGEETIGSIPNPGSMCLWGPATLQFFLHLHNLPMIPLFAKPSVSWVSFIYHQES